MDIVVVDDGPVLLRLLQDVLQNEGYRVLSFARPDSLMDLQHTTERVDLFLIDIRLPGMTGIELAARLTNAGFETAPKIAMSASPHLLQAAQASGLFHATLEKPFDRKDLFDRIQQCTGSSGHRPRLVSQARGQASA